MAEDSDQQARDDFASGEFVNLHPDILVREPWRWKSMPKPLVYIASPYTKGDPCINTNFQMRIFDEMMTDGVVIPIVPLWSHFQHTAFPRPYTDWIEYDLALIPRLDAVLRLNATSPCDPKYFITQSSGADGEVALFAKLFKPVFYDKELLYRWANNRQWPEAEQSAIAAAHGK